MRSRWVVALWIGMLTSSAHAQIFQPNGAQAPSTNLGCDSGRPTGLLPTLACICVEDGVCNIGDPCSSPSSCDDGRNGTCESRMFHVFNDNTCIPSQFDGLDPWMDASLDPETFTPTCGLTFTVESRGTAMFRNAFGWYNASSDGTPPDADDLHVMLDCNAAVGDSVVLDVRGDPAYRGGDVGFFLLTPEERAGTPGSPAGTARCAAGDCCASVERYREGVGFAYFSQRGLNPDERGAESFIHLLIYDSVISERTFHFAWEDTFDTANNDFTDLVTSVTGVECAGAGRDCDTGGIGSCASGITRCEAGALECVARYTGEGERCDGNDNDCDDVIDEEAPCPEDEVCDNGACVPNCRIGVEFACGLVRSFCDETGVCREEACLDVECPDGRTCRDGECRASCEGVVCPRGQTCFQDRCIDPCAEVTCGGGEVCVGGLCIPSCNQCDGWVCEADEICDESDGRCRFPACPAECPSGEVCTASGCVDACEGAVCPRGQVCRSGRCENLVDGEDAGVTDGGVRRDGGTGDGGTTDGGSPPGRGGDPGCACRTASRSHAAGVVLLLLLFARRRPWDGARPR